MNCLELQESLAQVEDGSAPEQSSHLHECPACSAMLEDINRIVATASELQDCDEPSPRVWNAIQSELRREGLIRPQMQRRPVSVPAFVHGWGGARWLVPLAALLLITIGIYERKRATQNTEDLAVVLQAAPEKQITPGSRGLNDDDLINEVASSTPDMRSQYEQNLQGVNEAIRDAQGTVDENPNDPEARRSLMDAYQQKSMLFEMAMDRSQP